MRAIRRRGDFVACAREGARAGGRAFLMRARGRDDGGEPRLGLTITKRAVSPLAVRRNRARRRLREAARLALAPVAERGCDYVLLANRAALTCPWPTLLADMRAAVARVRP